MINISGVVERVIFHNQEQGFCVLSIGCDKMDSFSLTGSITNIAVGQYIEASGKFVVDKKYGNQFKANILREVLPVNERQIESYLSSGVVSGIGKAYAKRLVDMFGTQVFEILDNKPEEFLKVGISSKTLDSIKTSWEDSKINRTLNLFLHEHKLSSYASKLEKAYGNDIIETIKRDPYKLIKDIKGIAFKTADEIALSLNLSRTSKFRIKAGINYTFKVSESNGHCGIKYAELIESTEDLLEIDREIIISVIKKQISYNDLIPVVSDNQQYIYQKEMYDSESFIADKLNDLSEAGFNWSAFTTLPLSLSSDIKLSEEQTAACLAILNSSFSILTGGPGVGKTTVLKTIVQLLKEKNMEVVLCAPTGKAARRLEQVTGCEAQTIHRKFKLRNPSPKGFEADIVIIDEASMIDTRLMYELLDRLPPFCALLLVGDVDQLPSIGAGQVLLDIIASGVCEVSSLTTIFRQQNISGIITNAHRINEGLLPFPQEDFIMYENASEEEAVENLVDSVALLKNSGVEDSEIQVLTPMKKGLTGTLNLNIQLQQLFNPSVESKREINFFGIIYRVGDRVIQTKNDYDKGVFNGMIGVLVGVYEKGVTETKGGGIIHTATSCIVVDFDEYQVWYTKEEIKDLLHAYAITIHKSQGSEFNHVIVPIMKQHYLLLKRNLIYTAITRAKKTVHLIQNTYALKKAVDTVVKDTRITTLKAKLELKSQGNEARAVV